MMFSWKTIIRWKLVSCTPHLTRFWLGFVYLSEEIPQFILPSEEDTDAFANSCWGTQRTLGFYIVPINPEKHRIISTDSTNIVCWRKSLALVRFLLGYLSKILSNQVVYFVIRVNLLHLPPFSFIFGLFVPFCCSSFLSNQYFVFFVVFRVILRIATLNYICWMYLKAFI